jgi:hypothetical protein
LLTHYTPTFDWSDSTPGPDHYQLQIAIDTAFTTVTVDQTVTSVHSVRTAPPPPDPNFPNSANPPQGLRPLFDWDTASGAESYTLQIATDRNFLNLVVYLNLTPTAHLPTLDLPRGVTLYWRVRANHPLYGSSRWSPVKSFDTPNPPGTPLLISPVGSMLVTSRTPTLDWADSLAAAGYEVQIATDGGFANVVARGQTSVSQYTPETPLAANTTYFWRVRAVGGVSPLGHILSSEWSLAQSFRIPP